MEAKISGSCDVTMEVPSWVVPHAPTLLHEATHKIVGRFITYGPEYAVLALAIHISRVNHTENARGKDKTCQAEQRTYI